MALFKPYKITSDKLEDLAIQEGQIIITTDTKKLYVDISATERIEVTSDAEVDLTDYVTTSILTSTIAEEASERQKQDQLLEQAVDDKLGADDIIAGSNVQVNHDNESGHITISATDTKYTAGTGLGMISNGFYILNGGVGLNQLANDSVSEDKLVDGAVDTAKIADGAVTADKLAEGVIPEIPDVTLASLGVTATAEELNYVDGVTSNIQTQLNNKAATTHNHAASAITSGTFSLDRIPTITDAKISGISANKITGTIASANLPSYVDDVLEYNGISAFPEDGEAGKIYVDTSTNKTYRWGGSNYVEISASLALGTTSSTAFRGDYGNTAYTHATAKGSAFSSGLYKITTNSQGHVTAATAVTKNDITALGIPAQDTNTNTTYELTKSGSTITLEGSDGSSTSVTDSNTVYTHPTTSGNKHIPAGGSSGQILRWSADGTAAWGADNNTNTTYTLSKSGSTITLTGSDGSSTSVTDANTTYSLGSFGITASAAELNKLDGVTATATELNYVDGVTSNIQTQLNGKAASSHSHSVASTSAAGFLRQLNGSTANYLRGDGTWATPPNTTYSDMRGATASAAGTHGLVPAPAAGAATRYLRSDGTWQVPPDTNTTYTLSSFGITATAAELNKLDGCTATVTELNYVDGVTSSIQTQLNGKAASSHTHSAATTSAAGFLPKLGGGTTNFLRADGTWAKPPDTNTTYSQMTGATSSAAGKTGLVPAPAAGYQSRYLRGDGTWATVTATSANQLTTTRTFSLTGDVTGSATFNGTANCSIATTLAANSVTANEIASGAVGLSELSSAVGTVAVQSSTPTDSHVKLWIKV